MVKSPRALGEALQVGQASRNLPCLGAGHANRASDVAGVMDLKLPASSSLGG